MEFKISNFTLIPVILIIFSNQSEDPGSVIQKSFNLAWVNVKSIFLRCSFWL